MNHPKYALLTTLLLAACGSEPSRDAAAGASPDSAVQAPAAVVHATADTISPATAPEQGAASIVLAPDGLTIGGGAGAPKRLAFGGAQAGVLADAGAALGEPKEQGNQEECPAGPLYQASYESGLQVVFQEGEFVGWFAREGSRFRTAEGMGPGSTLGELKKAYPATTVEESSLGHEFAAGELYGVVTGPSDAATVEVMFAGTNCIFR